MTKQFKAGQITAYVEGNIKEAKAKLGINWRGLIIRGIKAATGRTIEEAREQKEKISRMAIKIQEQSVRIYKLENKEVK